MASAAVNRLIDRRRPEREQSSRSRAREAMAAFRPPPIRMPGAKRRPLTASHHRIVASAPRL